ncbi:hypothetical protein PJIAN_4168 [Paludibacter jiangxiensis]|uniref:Uncharacterized protein n=1 Tax=Paludibacter jiangxiensis TaxID=681398 RepID=A0A171AF28_9BACT|nr:hypothetical protein PJIAN_4168 [Paludibacter jiangxiensis]
MKLLDIPSLTSMLIVGICWLKLIGELHVIANSNMTLKFTLNFIFK